MFTFDDDFLVEASRRQRRGIYFLGIVYADQNTVSIRQCLEDLQIIAQAGDHADLDNRVTWLPL